MSETRLTPERRAELARLCEAATPGPWYQAEHNPEQVLGEHGFITAVACSTPSMDARSMRQRASDQAAFIAASRTALPEALAEVDQLTALSSDERRRAERLHDDLLVEKGFVTVLRDDIARLKAKVARLEQEP